MIMGSKHKHIMCHERSDYVKSKYIQLGLEFINMQGYNER